MCTRNKEKDSTFDYNVKIKVDNKPIKRACKVQKYFLQWFRHNKIQTIIDFQSDFKQKLIMSRYANLLCVKTAKESRNVCKKEEWNYL